MMKLVSHHDETNVTSVCKGCATRYAECAQTYLKDGNKPI